MNVARDTFMARRSPHPTSAPSKKIEGALPRGADDGDVVNTSNLNLVHETDSHDCESWCGTAWLARGDAAISARSCDAVQSR